MTFVSEFMGSTFKVARSTRRRATASLSASTQHPSFKSDACQLGWLVSPFCGSKQKMGTNRIMPRKLDEAATCGGLARWRGPRLLAAWYDLCLAFDLHCVGL
jgi:hypothetical protein